MRPDQAPCAALRRLELPLSVTSCLREDNQPLLGGILSGTKRAWLSRGPFLQVLDSRDGTKIAAWTFGAVVRDFKTKVTCVTELSWPNSAGVAGPTSLILVGLECELTGGMVCVFNLAGSRVLRAINIQAKVTALSAVAFDSIINSPLHPHLQQFSGTIAVGTSAGHILLVDLHQRDCEDVLQTGHLTQWEGIRDELRPCALLSIKSADALRLSQERPDDHFYLHLNRKCFKELQKLVVTFPSGEYESFVPDNPSVSSLLYVPQLASLCVGFHYGSFQIWSLLTLTHVYTLPSDDCNPVVELAFQEACDDPNAYCYLWVVRGSKSSGGEVGTLDDPVSSYGPPSAIMYSLSYDEKVWIQDYGHLYKKFLMCSHGFEYDMDGDDGTVGGRLIALHSVGRDGNNTAAQASGEDSSALGPVGSSTSLCLLVWETWGPSGPPPLHRGADPSNIHMVLFDLNQWYVDHMPSRVSSRGGPSRNKVVAGYIVTYDLSEVLSFGGNSLLDVRINADSVLPFSTVQNVEEHSRPSALAFDSVFLLDRHITCVQHPGVQRALLSRIMTTGPTVLLSPTNVFHECLALGLRPLLMDAPNIMNVPIEEQRRMVLCVALEQRLGRFLSRCAHEWADGRQSAAGLTLSWLLSVAWNRASTLKQLAVRLCVQLFDHSGEKLDNNAQRQLHHVVGLMHVLQTLFQTIVRNKWHLSLSDWQQVELQSGALQLECQYYDVLQWFLGVELLPEGLEPTVPYPARDIAMFYHTRRSELQRLVQQTSETDDQSSLLMIDGMLNHREGGERVRAEWERDAGNCGNPRAGLYPPASLQALLRTFLVKDLSQDVKNSVVVYVLMDIAYALDSQEYQRAKHRFLQFPAAFHMSAGAIKLTQAFWHLDHKAFDVAIDMLLDPLVSARDMEPWQHRNVVYALLLQGQQRMALRYVRTRHPPSKSPCDVRVHLNLLIANDLIHEAFMYQRNHHTPENVHDLLWHFFKGCEEHGQLKTILQFSLLEDEERVFSKYLQTCQHPAADDLRVLYLLKRSRYVEALDVNQELRKKGHVAGTRDIVVNALYKTLPAVTRSLATHCAQQRNKIESWKQVERPSPLFIEVKKTLQQTRYKSSILDEALQKSRETWTHLIDRSPKPGAVESTPFLCTPRTKIRTIQSRRSVASSVQLVSSELKDRKRLREDEEETIFEASSSKRSKFAEMEGGLTGLQQVHQNSDRHLAHSSRDNVQLLHTPVVQRRSPAARAKLQQQMLIGSPAQSTITPQSIIKVRRLMESASSGEVKQRRVLFSDPPLSSEPELTEEESESEQTSSPVTGHTKGESETDSEGEDESSVQGSSARRYIEFDSESSSAESPLSDQSRVLPSRSPSPSKTPIAVVLSRRSLSQRVVLSEARKTIMCGVSPRKSIHSVTFGEDSVCVFNQDEPVDSAAAAALHEEPNPEDSDCIETTVEHGEGDSETDENKEDESQEEDENKLQDALDPQDKRKEEDDVVSEIPEAFSRNSLIGRDRLDTSGIASMEGSYLEQDRNESDVFYSAQSNTSSSFCSPTFRKNLARPSIKEMSRWHTSKRPLDVSPEQDSRKLTRLEGISRFEGKSVPRSEAQNAHEQTPIVPVAETQVKLSVCNEKLNLSSTQSSEKQASVLPMHIAVLEKFDVSQRAPVKPVETVDISDSDEGSNKDDSVEEILDDSDSSPQDSNSEYYDEREKDLESLDEEESCVLSDNSFIPDRNRSEYGNIAPVDTQPSTDKIEENTRISGTRFDPEECDTEPLSQVQGDTDTTERTSVILSRANASLGNTYSVLTNQNSSGVFSNKLSELNYAYSEISCSNSVTSTDELDKNVWINRDNSNVESIGNTDYCADSDSKQVFESHTDPRADTPEITSETCELNRAVCEESMSVDSDEHDDMPNLQFETSDIDTSLRKDEDGITEQVIQEEHVEQYCVVEEVKDVNVIEESEDIEGAVEEINYVGETDVIEDNFELHDDQEVIAEPEDKEAAAVELEDVEAVAEEPEDQEPAVFELEEVEAVVEEPEDQGPAIVELEDVEAVAEEPEDQEPAVVELEDVESVAEEPADVEAVCTEFKREGAIGEISEDEESAQESDGAAPEDEESVVEPEDLEAVEDPEDLEVADNVVSAATSNECLVEEVINQEVTVEQTEREVVEVPASADQDAVMVGDLKHGEQENIFESSSRESVQSSLKSQLTSIRSTDSVSQSTGEDKSSVCSGEGMKSSRIFRSRTSSVSSLSEEPKVTSRVRTRRASASSQNDSEVLSSTSQSQVRRTSVNSQDAPLTRSHRRALSVTSVDDESTKVLLEKLAGISEDDSVSSQGKFQSEEQKKKQPASKASSVIVDSPTGSTAPTKARRRRNSALDESISGDLKEKSVNNPADSVIAEYATTRRLTRHQHALLARSMEISSVEPPVHHRRSKVPAFLEEDEEEDNQASSDDDRMSHSSVRSSLRLRLKREQKVAEASPSSTTSTIMNPALSDQLITPSKRGRRRQSVSDAQEVNREQSPALSETRSRRSLQLCTTPTRRSTRLNMTAPTSAAMSEDGDNNSIASISPSSVASSQKSKRRQPRRRSITSEAAAEQFTFASPQIAEGGSTDTPGDVSMSFTFSPPKTVTASKGASTPKTTPKKVTTPKRSKSSPNVDQSVSGTRRSTRQSLAFPLQPIEEETSSRVNQDDSAVRSPVTRAKSRQSWFFVQPRSESEMAEVMQREEELREKQRRESATKKSRVYSAYRTRKEFSLAPVPKRLDQTEESDESSSENEKEGSEHSESSVRSRPSTRSQRKKD